MNPEQTGRIPSIDSYGILNMSLIERKLLLRGSRGQRVVRALFDSGASFSFVRRDIAESVGRPEALPEPIAFETAEAGKFLTVRDTISTNFFFEDTDRLFNDTIFILDELSEELIIGAKTLRAWQITLDFEHESVIYDKSLQRLRA